MEPQQIEDYFSDVQTKLNHTIRDVHDYPKEGIIFKDITPLLKDVELRKYASNMLFDKLNMYYKSMLRSNVDVIAGIESRGFFYGMSLAEQLGVPFIPIRKAGKLPFHKISQSYELEYGTATIEVHKDAIEPGQKVLIHDDLFATGGTVGAAGELIRQLGGEVAGFAFLIELDFLKGREKLAEKFPNVPVVSLLNY